MGNNDLHVAERHMQTLGWYRGGLLCLMIALAASAPQRACAARTANQQTSIDPSSTDAQLAQFEQLESLDRLEQAKQSDREVLRNTQENRNAEKRKHHEPDLSGKKRMGKASFYANEFAGRKMANGVRMDPEANNAASKTLPLGTTAKVTNLETGQSAVVTIQDRGPYVPGRIVDLSPATARKIGLNKRKGVAAVVVAPITVPQPDGKIRLGDAAREPEPGFENQRPLRIATADVGTPTVR
jgi:rare lipoprotein A